MRVKDYSRALDKLFEKKDFVVYRMPHKYAEEVCRNKNYKWLASSMHGEMFVRIDKRVNIGAPTLSYHAICAGEAIKSSTRLRKSANAKISIGV